MTTTDELREAEKTDAPYVVALDSVALGSTASGG
ncbi:hypothetical protein DFR70_103652 [Nocardia tenerifensis]|uniref:Uncharacterized protein n=1 Tax=Nocardia tenerifensis TaxID=228006 RepID=A0A318KTR4_9NOCA|nr:hypothetical protein DFR70_103652 [Nocardia tenerifensis]